MDSELKDVLALRGVERDSISDKYAKKGNANAGLTLGIIGTALAAFAPGIFTGGGFFNGYDRASGATAATLGTDAVALAAVLANSNGNSTSNGAMLELLYQQSINSLKDDFLVEKNLQAQICQMSEKLARLEAVQPYQMEVANLKLQSTDEKLVNYIDRLDCRNIKGIVGLPYNQTVNMIPGSPAGYIASGSCCGGNCVTMEQVMAAINAAINSSSN